MFYLGTVLHVLTYIFMMRVQKKGIITRAVSTINSKCSSTLLVLKFKQNCKTIFLPIRIHLSSEQTRANARYLSVTFKNIGNFFFPSHLFKFVKILEKKIGNIFHPFHLSVIVISIDA